MAFNLTSQKGRLVQAIGSFSELACGISALSGGAATVTVKSLARVDGVICSSQNSANVVYPDSTSGNVFTLSGGGSDNIMWIAWGIPRA